MSKFSVFRHTVAAVLFSVMAVMPLSSAKAASADMTLTPTRIVFDKGDRYAVVNLKNAGDAIGRYHIEISDTEMHENGGVSLLEGDAHSPFSAANYINIAPRAVTLNPGDYQTIRILLKNQDEMADGEYRSALKVEMSESDFDPTTNQAKESATAMTVRPKLVIAIPIIIRHGSTSFHVGIDNAQFVQGDGDDPHPKVKLQLAFDGTQSIIGDVKITHVDANGKDSLLKLFPGLAIYRGVSKLETSIPLEVPEGVNIHSGKTTVTLIDQGEGNSVLAQRDVTP